VASAHNRTTRACASAARRSARAHPRHRRDGEPAGARRCPGGVRHGNGHRRRPPHRAVRAWLVARALRPSRHQGAPNTAGCFTASEAVLTAKLAVRRSRPTGSNSRSLAMSAPCSPTGRAARRRRTARRRRVRGAAVHERRPGARPAPRAGGLRGGHAARLAHRSGLGIRNPHNLALIRELVTVPVILDAGWVRRPTSSWPWSSLRRRPRGVGHQPGARPARHGQGDASGCLGRIGARRAGRIPQRFFAEPSSAFEASPTWPAASARSDFLKS